MRRLPACLIAACFVASVASAAEFEKRTFEGEGGTLPYRLLSPPKAEAGKRYPLVIFLHGAGERGTDNEGQLNHCAKDFAKPEVSAKFPCFVVVPQCPGDCRWVEVDWGDAAPHHMPAEPSRPMKQLIALLPTLTKELPVDPDRIYVSGLSMGGFGTWDLVARLPGTFAAAVPMCGGADDSTAPAIAKLPIWAFHGADDDLVKPARTRSMIAALKQAGGDPKYTEYPGVGHGCWGPAFAEPELFPWLFAQKRAPAKPAKPTKK